MRFLWLLVYLLLGLLALVSTYEGLDRVLSTDAGTNSLLAGAATLWLGVSLSFVLSALFPLFCLRHYGPLTFGPLPRASFGRKLLGGWQTDPLQWVRLTTLWFVGTMFGALLASHTHGDKGGVFLWVWVASGVGLPLGEWLMYVTCKRWIA